MSHSCVQFFLACQLAIEEGKLIHRPSPRDKEFAFQNWVRDRLSECPFEFEEQGRNSYPDFIVDAAAEGYEVKSLAVPGRDTTFDANSQLPSGAHAGRTIYYVFGRYPSGTDSPDCPVVDLVVCHGDFLNAHHNYEHANRSFRGLGSYGDVLVRDRKMYVVPTPYALATGLEHQFTLILPSEANPCKGLTEVGCLTRREADEVVIAYRFNLVTNVIQTETRPNPTAGAEHRFIAYRVGNNPTPEVTLR